MDVRNCRSCGKIFNYIGKPICPACEKELEDKYNEVKAYIKENKGASINEVAEANDVSVKQIRTWVRQERLTFSDESLVGLECENCGKLIKTGRFCEDCKAKLGDALDSVTKKEPEIQLKSREKGPAKMHFLDSSRR